ncbi:MAG: o-succinylbenzoate synthase [Bacteroidetes bacterium]|nr:MAG: o-succinylbenzoate synthase [Bacteroidota bacterium]
MKRNYQFKLRKEIFTFKRPGGTSRGVLSEKKSWFLELFDVDQASTQGLGECSVIPGLTPEYETDEQYERLILQRLEDLLSCSDEDVDLKERAAEIIPEASILFGVEVAMIDLERGGKQLLFDSDFTRGVHRIPVNGLIWMGDETFMRRQIEEKLKQGYGCLKMKVGAIDFEREIAILSELRARFSPDELILRVDANGAFDEVSAMDYLDRLAELELHSIEQPIPPGKKEAMYQLCQESRLPIALDEELIDIASEQKEKLLREILPQYIILKPSLHGGFSGCREWIALAEELGIAWWITSALESNVGLNAIAQFVATYDNELHQGLGTGGLYTHNTPSKLHLKQGFMSYDS